MRIKLKNDYEIVATRYSYDLVKNVVSKNDKPYERTIGYFPNVALALKKYVEISVVATDEEIEMKEYIERYEELVREVLSYE